MTVALGPQTHTCTDSHKRTALLQFLSAFLASPATLPLRWCWSLDSSAPVLSQASQPRGPKRMKGRWVKEGETERQSESKKREEECKRRRTTSFTVLLLSSEWRREGTRGGEGGSGANLYYICFIHVVDTRVISVYDQWTVADCNVWEKKGRVAPYSPPK